MYCGVGVAPGAKISSLAVVEADGSIPDDDIIAAASTFAPSINHIYLLSASNLDRSGSGEIVELTAFAMSSLQLGATRGRGMSALPTYSLL